MDFGFSIGAVKNNATALIKRAKVRGVSKMQESIENSEIYYGCCSIFTLLILSVSELTVLSHKDSCWPTILPGGSRSNK